MMQKERESSTGNDISLSEQSSTPDSTATTALNSPTDSPTASSIKSLESIIGLDHDLEKGLHSAEDKKEDVDISRSKTLGWDGPDDPENPKNWSRWRKWSSTTIVSMIALTCGATSSAVAPAIPGMADELGVTSEINQSLIFAMYGFGFLVGALIYGPLSEIYGRVWVLNISTAIFLIFNLAGGFAQSYTQVLVFRFISSVGGTSTPTIGLGVISDCFCADDIGQGSAFYGLATQLGPAIGPLIAGFIVQNLGWRWVFYMTTIAGGVAFLSSLLFLRESRPSIKLKKRAKSLVKETGDQTIHTKEWPCEDNDMQKIFKGLKRPISFLLTHHIIQYLALYQFFLYGTLYLILQTYSDLFEQSYKQSIQIAGLNYISVGLGQVVGQQFSSRLSDKVYDYIRRRKVTSTNDEDPTNSVGKPEYRVPLMMLGSVIYPLGFLLYGWSAQYETLWLIPNIGIFLVSLALISVSQGIKLYILSAYGTFASSAQGATNLTRAVGMAAFPLFAPYLFRGLGYGWAGTLLAGLSIVLGIPGPILLWCFGERLRSRAEGLQMKTVEEERGDGVA